MLANISCNASREHIKRLETGVQVHCPTAAYSQSYTELVQKQEVKCARKAQAKPKP